LRGRNLLLQIPALRSASVVADGAGRSLGVELVRVVEDRRLRGASGRSVVVAGDGVQELGEHCGVEVECALLDHPQPEMDVAEQAPFLGRPERRSRPELANAADVVQECRAEDDVVAKPRVQLRGLVAEGGDADRVLEEASGIAVVPVRAGRGKRAKSLAELCVTEKRVGHRGETLVRDLGGEEFEEPVQLVRVAAKRRRQLGRVGVLGRLDGAHLHLELPAEALDASEDADGVAFAEALVEQIDVVPDARIHAAARIGELEREVRGSRAGASPLLLRDREHALDGPVLDELGDRGHVASLWREGVGTLAAMADVQPFRAVRYAGAAGTLADLVAPPYDAVTDAERAALYTRSPHNVVHVTLPESAKEAGRLYRDWLANGILVQDVEPSTWLAREEFIGPDGVARERHGAIVSLDAAPYTERSVLPHERTHPHIREERRRLLRETRVQPEPILVLAEAPLALSVPETPAELEVDGTCLWRAPAAAVEGLRAAQVLIADGHHRYEAAVELREELGTEVRIMALVVPTDDVGLQLYPTHRVFANRPDLARGDDDESFATLEAALARLDELPYERGAAVRYRPGSVGVVHGAKGELDVALVDRYGLDGIRYAPRLEDAVAEVDSGAADAAFLLRAPRVEDVFAAARRGERMPPKSTYFFPKPLSGLLFHPVTP
jgi:uncharacterized protein (DUF1015 family)